MSRTAQVTERKKVTFVNNDVDKETLAASHSSSLLSSEHAKLATPLSFLSDRSNKNDNSSESSNVLLQSRRNSLQPIKNMDAIASHCVNFDEFLSSIKSSNGQTHLNNNSNNYSNNTNGECDANGERVLTINSNGHNGKNSVNTNTGTRVERRQGINKGQLYGERINALEDPYAPQHQGGVYYSTTQPTLTLSSQNEESRHSVNSNSNSLGSIRYSQQPMRGKRLRGEHLHQEESQLYEEESEEEQFFHLSPLPSSAPKRRRLQPSCSLENSNNERSQQSTYSIRQGRHSISQEGQTLLGKYQSNIKEMNARLHKMETQLAEHLFPISQEIAESKVKYDQLCGKLNDIERILSQELKSNLTNTSVQQSELTREVNSTKSAFNDVKAEISKLYQSFTSMENKVNALSTTSGLLSGKNTTIAASQNETSSATEKPESSSLLPPLQPTQQGEFKSVENASSEQNNINPFSFVNQDNVEKINSAANESSTLGATTAMNNNDTTNKPANFFSFGSLSKSDTNSEKGSNDSLGTSNSATNTVLTSQQTVDSPAANNSDSANVEISKDNSANTLFAPITASTTLSFPNNDNENNDSCTITTTTNSSVANPFAISLNKTNTTSSPFSFLNLQKNTDANNKDNSESKATTNTVTLATETSPNADVNFNSTSSDNKKDDNNSTSTKAANPFTFTSSTNNFNFGTSTAANNNNNAEESTNATSPFFASGFTQKSNPSPISSNPFAFPSTSTNPFSTNTNVKNNEATNTLNNDKNVNSSSSDNTKTIADDKSIAITNTTSDSTNNANQAAFSFGFGQVANTNTAKADTSNTPFASTSNFASAFGAKLANPATNSSTTSSTSTTAFPFATHSTLSSTSASLPPNSNNNSTTVTNPFTFNSTRVVPSSAETSNTNNNNQNLTSSSSTTPAFGNTNTDNNINNNNVFSGFGAQSMTSSPFSSVSSTNANTNNIFGNPALPSTGTSGFGGVNNNLNNATNPFNAFGGGNSVGFDGVTSSNNNMSIGGIGSVDTHILGTTARKKTTRRY